VDGPTRATCCVVGCGPAGAVLGLLLARAGVDVLVLEKHADFLRDFRGDTLHASTLQLLDELGLAEDVLALPHSAVSTVGVSIGDSDFGLADFRRLRGKYRYIAFMPQWDLLDFLTKEASRLPTFRLRMQAEAVGVVQEGGRVVGVTVRSPDGAEETVRAELTVAADGRGSTVRRSAGLRPVSFGAPMDVLWFRLSKRDSDPGQTFGRIGPNGLLVLIDRGDYWQAGLVIPNGAYGEVQRRGMDAFRAQLAGLAPFLADRVGEVRDWEDVRMLDVQVDRLPRWWRPGLLCIGDAAHAMSPIAGVGINLAVQDAVAAANLLAGPLRAGGTIGTLPLARVQRRRTLPTVLTQRVQRAIQDGFLSALLAEQDGRAEVRPPRLLRVLQRVPALQAIPAWFVGRGVRPEHVRPPVTGRPGERRPAAASR
jgi:2-polyprenyl-6-methoxyphenol hydroxylase-like FAD-dependent oxidoreductase